jgi:hypothetical protein
MLGRLLDPDFTAVSFYEATADGETKACAASLAGKAIVSPIEAIKDSFGEVRWNTWAIILDTYLNESAIRLS